MRRVGAIALLLLGVACSAPQVQLLAQSELPEELYGRENQNPVPPRDVSVIVYFVQVNSRERPVRLAPVRREGRTGLRIAEFAMRQLLAGRIPDELTGGLRTAIRPGTELLGISLKDGVADVNLSAQFESAAAEILHQFRIAQVVWTLAELPDVESVRFRIHGVPKPVIDQDGIAHDKVAPARYSKLAPVSGATQGSTSIAP
jgi:spore germination protein GerM